MRDRIQAACRFGAHGEVVNSDTGVYYRDMKTILVAVDFSAVTGEVVQVAARLAKALDSRLCLVHIAPPDPAFVGYDVGPQTVRDAVAEELHDDHRRLHELEKAAQTEHAVQTKALYIQGPTVEKLLESAEEMDADMLVVGSHGHGALHHLLVGSVSEALLRKARRPVLVVPSPGHEHA